MQPKSKTYVLSAASSAYPWIPLNYEASSSFALAYNVVKSGTGDATYSVQGTISNILNGATAQAFDVVSAKTTSFFAGTPGIAMPLTGIRLNVTAVSGASTLIFEVLDAGVS